MKTIIALLSLLIIATAGHGQPVDTNGDLPFPYRIAEPGQTVRDIRSPQRLDETWTHLDPGVPPEGDYLGGIAFTPDGSRVLLTNRMTDNVTIFDWVSMQPLANVTVGRYPAAVAATDSLAVVACAFADHVYLIDLISYLVVDSIATGEQPWIVHLSPDEHYAYVACDIDDVCNVIDLWTREPVMAITGFPISLVAWSGNTANGRNDFVFTDFVLADSGHTLVASDRSGHLLFFNALTGLVEDTLSGIAGCTVIGLSGDRQVLVALGRTNPAVAYRISLASRAITDSVILSGYTVDFTFDVAVNEDGSKAYLGVSNNRSALVRFAAHDFDTYSECYSAFWTGTTPDHHYAIGGQYNFCLFDFQSEAIVGHLTGNSQYRGIVAPSNRYAAAHDPHRYEGIYFYDVTNPANPSFRGATMSGQVPEGDAPRFVAITPNGAKAIASDFLSNSATVIDLETMQTEAILPAGNGPWEVDVTSDSRWAVMCGNNTDAVTIIDLSNNSVADNVVVGGRPAVIAIAPDDSTAYVGNISGNTISAVALRGANSYEEAEIPCGEIGVVWASYGVASDIELSPNGAYLLVAESFDDRVRVIDTGSFSTVAQLTVGDFPIQIAFAGSDETAIVTNYFSANFSILFIDGPRSSVIGTYPVGDYPLRLAYNSVSNVIGIGLVGDMQVKRVNPQTGAIVGTTDYAVYGSVTQVAYDASGDEIVLTTGQGNTPPMIHRGADHTELPAAPAAFDLHPLLRRAVVGMPGPDYVTVVDWEGISHPPTPFSLLAPPDGDTIAYAEPNTVNIAWEESVDPDTGGVVRYDAVFRIIYGTLDTTRVFAGLADTSYIVSLMDSVGIPRWDRLVRITWRVRAISGTDTVDSNEQWRFYLQPPPSVVETDDVIPVDFGITSVYPNPFNATTVIRYRVAHDEPVTLRVYDIVGRLVATLVDGRVPAGEHALSWDGSRFASGMYWLRLETDGRKDVRKMVFLK